MTDDNYQRAREAFDRYAGYKGGEFPFDAMAALQVDLYRWESERFGYQPGERSVIGVFEEMGELSAAIVALAAASGPLAHATLKNLQGVRGFDSKEKARRAIADAIGDMCVFMAQVCTAQRIDFATVYRETAFEVMNRNVGATPKESK